MGMDDRWIAALLIFGITTTALAVRWWLLHLRQRSALTAEEAREELAALDARWRQGLLSDEQYSRRTADVFRRTRTLPHNETSNATGEIRTLHMKKEAR